MAFLTRATTEKQMQAAENKESARQTAELAALRRMLSVSEGTFSLSFAVYNVVRLRDEIVETLTKEVPGIRCVYVPPESGDVLEVVSDLKPSATVSVSTAGSGKASGTRETDSELPCRAIFVLDLERALSPAAQGEQVLRSLNASRELWEQFHCPVVFWLAEHAASLVASRAMDLWRYRSHTFEFTAPPQVSDELSQGRFPGYDMIAGLPYEEKRFRRAELEQRLAEAGSPPSSAMLPHVLDWMYELAALHEVFSDWAASESLLRKALLLSKAEYGDDSPGTARAQLSLAGLLRETNRLSEAESLMRRGLILYEQLFEPGHPNVAAVLNNLAQLLKESNRLAAAELIMRRVVKIYSRSFGRSDVGVAGELSNLAVLLQESNRSAAAESLVRHALSIFEESHDYRSLKVAACLNNMAKLFQSTNRPAIAELLYRRVISLFEESLGSSHPTVATCANNLAHLLKTSGRLTEAEVLFRRVVKIFVNSLGNDHPKVAAALNNLAAVFRASGQLTEAEMLMRSALSIDEPSLGSEHVDVGLDLNNLAALLKDGNRLSDAEPLCRRAMEIFELFERATDHPCPYIDVARRNFAAVLKGLGRNEADVSRQLTELAQVSSPLPSILPDVERLLGPPQPVEEVFATLDEQYKAENRPPIYFLSLDEPISPHLDDLLGPSLLDIDLNGPISQQLDKLLGPCPSVEDTLAELDRQYREQNKPPVWFLPLSEPISPHLDELLGPIDDGGTESR